VGDVGLEHGSEASLVVRSRGIGIRVKREPALDLLR
jgi:hypothetical protein